MVQQVAGYASAPIAADTLFALTPLGLRLIKDGKVQHIGANSEENGLIEVSNPMQSETGPYEEDVKT